jgi:hypothetical protein
MRGEKMLNKEKLHKVEMELVRYCENTDVSMEMMREVILNKFTDLMSEVTQ